MGGGGLWSELERENTGLRNWLCRLGASGWHSGRLYPRGAARTLCVRSGCMHYNRLWEATERLEGKEILKMMVSGAAKTVKWWCSGFFFLCHLWKWYMLWSGNLELKMRVSRVAHTQCAHIWKCPPPPPRARNLHRMAQKESNIIVFSFFGAKWHQDRQCWIRRSDSRTSFAYRQCRF